MPANEGIARRARSYIPPVSIFYILHSLFWLLASDSWLLSFYFRLPF